MARNERREPEDDPTGSEPDPHPRDCGNDSTVAKVADAIRAAFEAVRLWDLLQQDGAPDTGSVADALVKWISSII
ncbi:hypothetical protein [Actinoplanes sp. G11-F43]|uniref:hypothetical protein n=1 Tax=Actinoplanes sp. G11-F43 TaxID=3424130 RepID=UPI003D34BA1B